jgi:acetyltransferase-like isoleucine patch superfamily enzyme
MSLYRYLATSDSAVARAVRGLKRGVAHFSLPVPGAAMRPVLWLVVTTRSFWHFLKRVLVCEPLFKAYCHRYGRNLRTGCFLHWVQGRGRIIAGDHCWFDGRSTFTFAARYAEHPTLEVGDHSAIGHDCALVVAKRIRIGKHCLISGGTVIIDSSGHHTDPDERRLGHPPPPEDVREVTIGDDVWVGMRCFIFPGVRIGNGSIIAAGSVVRTHVPPYAVAAGNPARVVLRLRPPAGAGTPAPAPASGATTTSS